MEALIGDSLGIDWVPHSKVFVAAAIHFTVEKNVTWIYRTENYMLDILKYAKKQYRFRCGAYSLA